MATILKIDPVTRLEGHCKVEVTIDTVGGVQKVTDAKCSGNVFRGFENMLIGHDPLDAPHYTQRICGVCPVSHGMASVLNLENAFALVPSENGRILRNLVLGSNFIQSHILHFYHLAALDYIDTSGILDLPPFFPRLVTPDMVGGATAAALVGHYVTALEMRRKAHQMAAIFGGKIPHVPSFVPGGCTATPTAATIADFRALLTTLRGFVDGTYIPDVLAVAGAFPAWYGIGGTGAGNLLSYGVFDLESTGTTKLLARGVLTNGTLDALNVAAVGPGIREHVTRSYYSSANDLHPSAGVTTPDAYKAGAYSWTKAPRYGDVRHEAGPLARMWINGDYTNGVSVIDREAARALEAKKVADAMDGWLDQLVPDATSYIYKQQPYSGTGVGLTEAPRGALGHWMTLAGGTISRYQVITPTAWNAGPKDLYGNYGPIEAALVGTPIPDINQPVGVMRVIHSFDPCLSCSVHMVRPDSKAKPIVLDVRCSAL